MAQPTHTWQTVIEDALAAVEPVRLIRDNLRLEKNRLFIKNRSFDLNTFGKIHVIGAGKGAAFLFEGLNRIMGSRIGGGIIVSLPEHAFKHKTVTFMPGAHPLPDQSSLKAGQEVIRYIKRKVKPGDLVIFLITGGASAMLVQPEEELQLEDKIEINRLLLASGAEISEINCVRKSMSAIKGGKLAQMVHPARLISLILSDVIDSALGDIGSGPSITHTTPISAAFRILEKYRLTGHLPASVNRYFSDAMEKESVRKPLPPVETHPGPEENVHFLLADNRIALEAARDSAEAQGIETHILTSRDKGEASEAAKLYAAIIKEIIYTRTPFKPPVLLLSGGELTVTLASGLDSVDIMGKGGRNQAFVLYLLKELRTVAHPFYIASIGTDGIDGPTDAAGAWIDQDTAVKARAEGLEIDTYLESYNSYRFFQKISHLIKTGPTRTNVMDMRLFYIPDRG